jgi:chaperonin GroEL (HSP60 family)
MEAAAIDNSNDADKFRQDLFLIARTTLSSKVVTHVKDYFANLAVDAVLRLKVCIIITSKPFSQPWYSSQNFLLLFL